MLMKKYASRHGADGHALLLVAPGWVRTEMGGRDATLSIEESIPLVVDAVEANRDKPGLRSIDWFNRTLDGEFVRRTAAYGAAAGPPPLGPLVDSGCNRPNGGTGWKADQLLWSKVIAKADHRATVRSSK